MVRITATSDFHGTLPQISPSDLLLIAGDICPPGSIRNQADWLNKEFRKWLHEIPVKEVVGIAGNHDKIFEKAPDLIPPDLKWHYLRDSSITLFGLQIFGSPWQLPFYGSFNLSDGRLFHIYATIPEKTDIMLSHGAPYNIQDSVTKGLFKTKTVHTGSKSLRSRMLEIKPKLCIFGHIHDSYGIHKEEGILFANVSLLNNDMEMVHPPLSFDL